MQEAAEKLPAPPVPPNRLPLVWLLLPLVAALVAHAPTLFCGFAWDDVTLVGKHPELGSPGFLGRIFFRDYGLEFGGRNPAGYYRPLFMVLNVGLFRVFGPVPLVYHLVSVLSFGAVAMLIAWLVSQLSGKSGVGLAAGTLFAVHPALTEIVSFFSAIPDIFLQAVPLVFVVAVLALGRSPERDRYWVLVGFLLAFASGLMKETAFMLIPPMGAVVALSIRKWDRSGRTRAAFVAAAALGLSIAFAMRKLVPPSPREWTPSFLTIFGEGSGRAFTALGDVIRDILLPAPAEFMRWHGATSNLATIVGVILVLAVLALIPCVLAWRGRVALGILAAAFAAGLFNVMVLRAIDLPYSARYFLLSPLFVIGALILSRVTWNRWSRIGWVAYGLMATTSTAIGAAKCINSLSLFRAMAEDEPKLAYPRIALCSYMFYEFGDVHACDRYFDEAAAISPNTTKVRELGKIKAQRHLIVGEFEKALEFANWAGEALPKDGEVYSLRAQALWGLGRREEALAQLEEGLRVRPGNIPCLKQLEKIRAAAGK